MKDHRKKYDFENMEIGDTRFFSCKKGDRDRLRNSLQTAARSKKMRVKAVVKETGIEYTLIELIEREA